MTRPVIILTPMHSELAPKRDFYAFGAVVPLLAIALPLIVKFWS